MTGKIFFDFFQLDQLPNK